MKKIFVLTVALNALTFGSLYADDVAATPNTTSPSALVVDAPVENTVAQVETVVEVALPVTVPAAEVVAPVIAEPVTETPAPSVTVEPAVVNTEVAADNLEFISGEITAMDEAAKTVSIKMYGETAENEADKMLAVTVDANTDITDGEQDRDLKSLTNGTEVDVEYDPSTKKATYIFVY